MTQNGRAWLVRCGVLAAAGLVAISGMTGCGDPRGVAVETREFFSIEVPTSLPTNEVAVSKEGLGRLWKVYGIPGGMAGLESLDFTNHAVIFSVDASVAEVRSNPGVDIILLQPEQRRGLYVAVVRGRVNKLGKFTWR